uniref:Pentatricopeptide repeat-containing protein n=1 Tax=Ananas comosus var. bracteatus TaxID=296719 RepID=A0A6V7QII0_ANACO|nr:unnamed protein product [Ananas comosus var. bracteatus]
MEHRGLNPGPAVLAAIIQNLCKCNKLNQAEKYLAVMRQKTLAPTRCIYDALITCCCDQGNKKRALQFYDEMTRNKLIPSSDAFMTLAKKLFIRKHETQSLRRKCSSSKTI